MVVEIIHSAIARKMLCTPANSLIADTEFLCAVGILLRFLNCLPEEEKRLSELGTIKQIQNEVMRLLDRQDSTQWEETWKNLVTMLKNYDGEENELTEEYQGILKYGYEHQLVYPKMNL